MKSQKITGGGGTQLHVVETGNPQGRPILFIHGFSQCWLAWSRQMNSDLAEDYRMVAMDMRGHGLSDKPRDGYGDSKLWADDVNAVIQSLNLDHPVLCGWSYGPLVILDYIRHYGEDAIGGIHFVGGSRSLGVMRRCRFSLLNFSASFQASFPRMQKRVCAAWNRCCECALSKNPQPDLYLMLGYNLSVPPYVRQALFSRSFDNDDLLPKIRKPVLITHGADEAVVKPAASISTRRAWLTRRFR